MSTENRNSDGNRDDEIDLRKLFEAIGKGFSNIGKSFVNLIIRIRRVSISYRVLLLSAIILGGAIGVSFNRVLDPYYSTSMLLSSDYFNNRLIENNLDKLKALCEEKNRDGLANLLQIEKHVALNIKDFDFEALVTEEDLLEMELLKANLKKTKIKDIDIDKVIEQIEIQNSKTYKITVHVFDNTIIGNLEESIIAYFKENNFVKSRIAASAKNNILLRDNLRNDISRLDSLKKLFNLNLRSNAGRKNETASLYVGESGLLDPVSFYSQSVELYKLLEKTERKIMLGDDFELIDGFTAFSKPESPGLIKAGVLSMLIFLGLGYLIIIFIEINKHLNKIEKERFNHQKD